MDMTIAIATTIAIAITITIAIAIAIAIAIDMNIAIIIAIAQTKAFKYEKVTPIVKMPLVPYLSHLNHILFCWCKNLIKSDLKGACKYYISTLGGGV